uniref:LAGLIDADG endonuclease n=1 Tax=Ophiocordycipitaceae sp. TaxID=1907519 RepID=A0A6M8PFZ5_9HYPO|nr:LAGLIDADG endonuclease [Ophiocordycipitaceae sp.]QKG63774.1 LAGLIDADG endonuclease [Ophiocordycipitaceae sp.]
MWIIIPHFTNSPHISRKQVDFLLWSKVIELILNKNHLTKQGFFEILSYYASINRGISNKVKKYFSNIIPANKPMKYLPENLNPQWVSGFVGGDGGFSLYVRPAKDYVLLEKVYCRFHIAQLLDDFKLMELFLKFFNCGSVSKRSNIATPRCDFIVQDTNYILDKVLPHFDSYPVLNLKQKDYISFKQCMIIETTMQG